MALNLAGKKALVVGLGKSGAAAARLCLARGAHVTITDSRSASDLGAFVQEFSGKAELELGGHQEKSFLTRDLIVLSPGVPPLPELERAQRAGIPILGELELSYRFVQAPIVAITGTNGKSTTTELVGAILAHGGRPVFCGGNLGTPLADGVGTPACGPDGQIVVEVSSFQLETVEQFHAHVAVYLNLSEDHLDRYASMAQYHAAKARIFERQMLRDFAIVSGHAEQQLVERSARESKACVLTFFRDRPATLPKLGGWLEGNELKLRIPDSASPKNVIEETYPRDALKIPGSHNTENALAALLAARASGASREACLAAMRSFKGLPHRTQLVRELRNVRYYNDSKGTNVDAAVQALRGFTSPVVLIAGGKDKGGDYAPLAEIIAQRCRAVVLIGKAAERMNAAFAGRAPLQRASDLPAAVTLAQKLAQAGDAVLLSPACSSFDMFRNYEHRGDVFTTAVNALT